MAGAEPNSALGNLKLFRRGKVRDVYDLGAQLLIVATDRISAFDVVLPTPIPDKGKVLTQLSAFWFNRFQELVPNHMIAADVRQLPEPLSEVRSQKSEIRTGCSDFSNLPSDFIEVLSGRAMLVKKTEPLPVECVVRGYLAGSGWKDYQRTGAVCGIALPGGLQEAARLPEPIFTPATKALTGHDENITQERLAQLIGPELAQQVERVSLGIYRAARSYAEERGIVIADTKFEFGLFAGKLMLIDEVLTPDSSRFWPMADYRPGSSPPSFDKQFVRDYLERIGWNKQPPAPELPPEIVAETRERYLEAYRRLTGQELQSQSKGTLLGVVSP
jgi:phosphoribosylaminoimidazole-succinocarboxamide synthase